MHEALNTCTCLLGRPRRCSLRSRPRRRLRGRRLWRLVWEGCPLRGLTQREGGAHQLALRGSPAWRRPRHRRRRLACCYRPFWPCCRGRRLERRPRLLLPHATTCGHPLGRPDAVFPRPLGREADVRLDAVDAVDERGERYRDALRGLALREREGRGSGGGRRRRARLSACCVRNPRRVVLPSAPHQQEGLGRRGRACTWGRRTM